MALTHKVGVVYSSDAGTITNTTDSYSADGEVNYDGTIAPATTNEEIDIAVDVDNIKSMVLYSTTAVTVKTNSTTSPAATVVLAAGKQVVWTTDHLEANPLGTGSITKFYVTNAGGSTSTFKFRALADITP
jgi:hypothetical protein